MGYDFSIHRLRRGDWEFPFSFVDTDEPAIADLFERFEPRDPLWAALDGCPLLVRDETSPSLAWRFKSPASYTRISPVFDAPVDDEEVRSYFAAIKADPASALGRYEEMVKRQSEHPVLGLDVDVGGPWEEIAEVFAHLAAVFDRLTILDRQKGLAHDETSFRELCESVSGGGAG